MLDNEAMVGALRRQRRGPRPRRDASPHGDVAVVGSTDMGNVSYLVPSIHPMIAAAPSGLPIHTPEFAEPRPVAESATGRWSTAPSRWPGRSPTSGSATASSRPSQAEFAATMDRVGDGGPAVRDRGGGRGLTYGSRRLPRDRR